MRALGFLSALLLAAAIAVTTAGADGSPYAPGLTYGWPGVAARGAPARFVAFGMPKSSIVALVRARDGHVLRSTVVPGFLGVPWVAFDGTTGGLSGDGRSLVLASNSPAPGGTGRTRFVVLDTRALTVRRRIVLDGSWSFDAVSRDASMLYLTEYLRAGDPPLYRVRTFDVSRGRIGGAIVDRREGERDMGGLPIARAGSADGRWAYTLYVRRGNKPFVHALDTENSEAYCIDLPLRLGYVKQWGLRLGLTERGASLSVRLGRRSLARVDTGSWEVTTSS